MLAGTLCPVHVLVAQIIPCSLQRRQCYEHVSTRGGSNEVTELTRFGRGGSVQDVSRISDDMRGKESEKSLKLLCNTKTQTVSQSGVSRMVAKKTSQWLISHPLQSL